MPGKPFHPMHKSEADAQLDLFRFCFAIAQLSPGQMQIPYG